MQNDKLLHELRTELGDLLRDYQDLNIRNTSHPINPNIYIVLKKNYVTKLDELEKAIKVFHYYDIYDLLNFIEFKSLSDNLI